MKIRLQHIALLAWFATSQASAAEKMVVTVSHDLATARPSETISVLWSEVNRVMPGALVQKIIVRDGSGRILPHQVTNIAPLSKDPGKAGIAYGELLFQHSFAAGQKTATFTVEKSSTLAPPFAVKAFARHVQERLDDFAWENDRLAHRTYGPALGAPAQPGSGKEVLVTSGLDIWFKRVDYPIVDRWYNKGHDHYHVDQGEGMDMYNVGKSRGAGGTGIWDGKALFTSTNFKSWKVVANGPVRAIFELAYDSWDAGGVTVTEVKRFTVDAGHQLDQVDSTFTFTGPAQLTVAVGLNKNPADKKQDPKLSLSQSRPDGTLLQWVEQASNGAMGTAVVLPGVTGFAEDGLNHLILAPVSSGQPLRYYVGAAWDRAGHITSQDAWKAYVAAAAARAKNPLRVRVETPPAPTAVPEKT